MFDQYYTNQQRGQGDFPVYIGNARQRGHGLGNIIGGLFRRILPFIKSITPHVLRSGANIVDDVKSGKSWKEAVFKRVPETVGAFARGQTGHGSLQTKISRKRKRKTKRTPVKKCRRDIFS